MVAHLRLDVVHLVVRRLLTGLAHLYSARRTGVTGLAAGLHCSVQLSLVGFAVGECTTGSSTGGTITSLAYRIIRV